MLKTDAPVSSRIDVRNPLNVIVSFTKQNGATVLSWRAGISPVDAGNTVAFKYI